MLRTATFALVALVCLPAWGQKPPAVLPHDKPLRAGMTGTLPDGAAHASSYEDEENVVAEIVWTFRTPFRGDANLYARQVAFAAQRGQELPPLVNGHIETKKGAVVWLTLDAEAVAKAREPARVDRLPTNRIVTESVFRVAGTKEWGRRKIPHLVQQPAE